MDVKRSGWDCTCGTRNALVFESCRSCGAPASAGTAVPQVAARLPSAPVAPVVLQAPGSSVPAPAVTTPDAPASAAEPDGLGTLNRGLGLAAAGISAVAALVWFCAGQPVLRGSVMGAPGSRPGGAVPAGVVTASAAQPVEPPPLSPVRPVPVGAPLTAAPLPREPAQPPAIAVPPAQGFDLPAAPSLITAPSSEPQPVAPPVMAGSPSPVPDAAPVTGAPGWRERPSQQETPEIRIYNEAYSPFVFALRLDGVWRRATVENAWHCQLPAGEYEYAICGSYFRRSGEPDMVGKVRCRRFRLYEFTIVSGIGNSTNYTDLGDD